VVSALDVEVNKLLEKVASELRKSGLEKPRFVDFVKSGAHKERPPEQDDFWYVRCAAILRYLYVHGPTGVQRLRSHFGGRKNRGRKPEHKVKAGGKIIRSALQLLEKAGFVKKDDSGKGREITPAGVSLLDRCAKEVVKK
jgi:small subunit ribosomal protein S19e